MAEFEKHLYMIIFPINALLSSQLEPEQLGEHYVIGSAKHFRGKMIFAEIDINFRDPYFEIDKALDETVAHTDGSPKKTKFISLFYARLVRNGLLAILIESSRYYPPQAGTQFLLFDPPVPPS